MEKIELTTELLRLYDTRKYVTTKAAQLIVDDYIRKLELKLGGLLINDE